MPGHKRYKNAHIIDALKRTRGLVFLAAKKLGCTPQTIYLRCKSSPEVAACLEACRGEMLDVAEEKLFAAVKAREPWAVAMLLKTLGKNRGYVERTETRTITDDEIERELADMAGRSEAAISGAPETKECSEQTDAAAG